MTQQPFPPDTPVGLHYKYGGILSDVAIRELVKIEPFAEKSPPGVISYGLTSYGYDMRVGHKFKVFTNVYGAIVDPKGMKPTAFADIDLSHPEHEWIPFRGNDAPAPKACARCGELWSDEPGLCLFPDHVVIPPNSFVLAESVETFEIPRKVLAVCVGKSTMARCGIIVNVTPLEPEWRGKVTIEISNTTPLPCKIYAEEGISQVLFFMAPLACHISYADKKGRYQDQKGLTLPFVNKE